MNKWDGQTKGSLWGYKVFGICVSAFGLSISYLLCYFVSLHFLIFAVKQRKGLMAFYTKSFGISKWDSFHMASKTFFKFGQTLIDKIAMHTRFKSKFSYEFKNEQVLKKIIDFGKGGILISGHVGNWEIAGNLIHDRISTKINIVTLDNEVESIKAFMDYKTGGPKYKLIPIKSDLSHVLFIKQALDRNELVIFHADRALDTGKNQIFNFFGSDANFPMGPFILAHKFKVPVIFVYATKVNKYHYHLSASDLQIHMESAEAIAGSYVKSLEEKVKEFPDQWFNFYNYHVN